MRASRSLLGLLAGLLAFDLLLNVPRIDAASPILSLLAPSIDLLIVAAVCWGIAQGAELPRRGPRILACGLVAFLLAYALAARFGVDVVLRLFGGGSVAAVFSVALSAGIAAVALGAVYLLTGLVAAGFQKPMVRNIFLLVVAISAILQVFTHNLLFTPSILARAVLDLLARLR